MKTLGQIAYEAAARVTDCDQPRGDATQYKWEEAANAVANECISKCEEISLQRAHDGRMGFNAIHDCIEGIMDLKEKSHDQANKP